MSEVDYKNEFEFEKQDTWLSNFILQGLPLVFTRSGWLLHSIQLTVCTFRLLIFPICLWKVRDCPLVGWSPALAQRDQYFERLQRNLSFFFFFYVQNCINHHISGQEGILHWIILAQFLATLLFQCNKGWAASDIIFLLITFLLLQGLFYVGGILNCPLL